MTRYSGIILAGGASRRMVTDKALLELGGRPVLTRLADELSQLAESTIIACGPRQRQEYNGTGLLQVTDIYPDCGPLAGLHAALSQSQQEWNLVAACDLPFASAEFLRYMLTAHAESQMNTGSPGQTGGADAVVAVSREGRVQPLLGLYHKRMLPVLETALEAGNYRFMDCLNKLDVLYVPESGFTPAAADTPSPVFNMNTPEDYAAAAAFMQ
ncbi:MULTISPECIES: molybdenum cofactor guanylyltransferase [unclassified Paenibacillus]|uniref:molybdenum cofactor guanylyltransferase n=1 Tax=unclassified Paenibacillus TaxID=185978 RepID=UPI002406A3EF|nr:MULTISPECIES: molybdenum cofactor guanylyltransferase [unclassified Paenibacillus]MDF9840060.1 molybdopterin-guanine dinucleotide biosynthesis protein A [Paenibacillus sp. PastF-2]MDF9846642.1 molybdopterin-guanine dinucleotide biosynthesis protein A [Paenibacillus sp. PastM-2]MDF9853010.1 molybdopterin-guanine dinucleotide biosynthesis protein A [Paenibacillus sp. PastF-1]MDH6478486.1 molybdopterin-guanine dinucleotide biosynthesis protein A [Paenibacillus sp. PastH-2]MDH6506016.1 molybdop